MEASSKLTVWNFLWKPHPNLGFVWNMFPSIKSKEFPGQKSNEGGSVLLTPSSVTEMLTNPWNIKIIIWPFCRKEEEVKSSRFVRIFIFNLAYILSAFFNQCWQYPLNQSKCRGAFKTKLLLTVTAALLSSWGALLLLLLLYFSAVFVLLKVIDCFPQLELSCFPQHCLQFLFLPVFFVQVCTSIWFHFNLYLLLWTACAAPAVAGTWNSGISSKAFLSIFFQPI